MIEQYRASDEDWRATEILSKASSVPACVIELRDRVMAMDACIRDIYDTLDTLTQRCDRNYRKASEISARVEKLEQPTPPPSAGEPVKAVAKESLIDTVWIAYNIEVRRYFANRQDVTSKDGDPGSLDEAEKLGIGAAILAVADWLSSAEWNESSMSYYERQRAIEFLADMLRREARG